MVLLHVVAGGLSLIFGFVALSAAKGATLHRKSGMLFVFTVLIMALTGTVMAALNAQNESVIGGVLTIYLVTTSLIAVRPPTVALRRGGDRSDADSDCASRNVCHVRRPGAHESRRHKGRHPVRRVFHVRDGRTPGRDR